MNQRRKKASDLSAENEPVWGGNKSGTFTEAFPSIKHLKITVTLSHRAVGHFGLETVRQYDLEHPPSEHVNCNDPLCYGGGFSIGEVLREMIRNKETKKKGFTICMAYLSSPKGRVKYKRCLNQFNYDVEIAYKPE